MNSNETPKPTDAVEVIEPQDGKPARDERGHWLSGQSGNPGGRPKKKPVTEIYEEILRLLLSTGWPDLSVPSEVAFRRGSSRTLETSAAHYHVGRKAAAVAPHHLQHLSRNRRPTILFHDIEVHVRFLIALPVLVGAELIVHSRIRPVVHRFTNRPPYRGRTIWLPERLQGGKWESGQNPKR